MADELLAFLGRGGPAMWAIAALSVLTLAIVLWKLLALIRLRAWGGGAAEAALSVLARGDGEGAHAALAGQQGLRARTAAAALAARAVLPEVAAREETERVAAKLLREARSGLRALELISTIAPLLGLLGTVLGMIDAFRALEAIGARADPATLAGGIWEALLTTAAGMAVAIPAGAALAFFESVADRAQADMEDIATRIFTLPGARE